MSAKQTSGDPYSHGLRRPGRPRAGTDDGRQRLIEAALRVFAAQGFRAANLRGIAAEAGVDAALVAHHFGSKEQLWQATVMSMMPQLEEALAAIPPPAPDVSVGRRLTVAVEALVDIHCERTALSQFIAREILDNCERLAFLTLHVLDPYRYRLLPLIVEAMDAGVVPRQEPTVVFFSLMMAFCMPIAAPWMVTVERSGLAGEIKRSVRATFLRWAEPQAPKERPAHDGHEGPQGE
jgi:TetR/AcrR family transcriptional regulator